MPDVKYTPALASELDYLMQGWLKCKEHIGSNLKSTSSASSSASSTPDDNKVIHSYPQQHHNPPSHAITTINDNNYNSNYTTFSTT